MTASVISLCVIVVAILTGAFIDTGSWYSQLEKPPYSPPDWVFGPVWLTIYLTIAAGAICISRTDSPRRSRAFAALAISGLFSILWSLLFFQVHSFSLSFAALVALWATGAYAMRVAWPLTRLGSVLLLPYVAWTLFAGVLHLGIWYRSVA